MQLHLFEPIPGPATDETLATTLARAAAAEPLGYAGVWWSESGPAEGGLGAALHLAAAWLAARTERIRVGTDLTLTPAFHPLRFAEEIALLDILSDGRFDWSAAPPPAPPGPGREAALRTFREQLEIVEKACSGLPFAHAGERFEIPPLRCLPAPARPDGPASWIAVADDDADDSTVAWAGSSGRGLRAGASMPVARLAGLQRAHRAAADDPTTARLSLLRFVHVDERDARARETAASALAAIGRTPDPERDVVGDPVACRERLAALDEAAEVALLLCWHRFGALPADSAERSSQLFLERVAPHLA